MGDVDRGRCAAGQQPQRIEAGKNQYVHKGIRFRYRRVSQRQDEVEKQPAIEADGKEARAHKRQEQKAPPKGQAPVKADRSPEAKGRRRFCG